MAIAAASWMTLSIMFIRLFTSFLPIPIVYTKYWYEGSSGGELLILFPAASFLNLTRQATRRMIRVRPPLVHGFREPTSNRADHGVRVGKVGAAVDVGSGDAEPLGDFGDGEVLTCHAY